jgi:hypothetical protein
MPTGPGRRAPPRPQARRSRLDRGLWRLAVLRERAREHRQRTGRVSRTAGVICRNSSGTHDAASLGAGVPTTPTDATRLGWRAARVRATRPPADHPTTGLGRRVGIGVENTRAGRRVGDRGDGPSPPRSGAAIGEHQPVAQLARREP